MIKVLYLHGFEEMAKPLSPKPASLVQHKDLDVHMPALGIYLTHRNSPVLSALCSPWFHATIFVGIVGAEIIGNNANFTLENGWSMAVGPLGDVHIPPLFWSGLIFWAISFWFLRTQIFSSALSRSVAASYAVAKHQVAVFKPDVIVGFSWGGALALKLMKDKAWDGPVVLLSPAYSALFHEESKNDPDFWTLDYAQSNQVRATSARDRMVCGVA